MTDNDTHPHDSDPHGGPADGDPADGDPADGDPADGDRADGDRADGHLPDTDLTQGDLVGGGVEAVEAEPADSGFHALLSPTGWSLWADSPPWPPHLPRPRARGALTADVCVVGAGYTGLWTAYYLARTHPALRVFVVEKDTVGSGASGRGGGWCSARFPAAAHAARMRPALTATLDEIGAVTSEEGIDCDFQPAGRLTVATTPAQAARLRRQAGGDWLDAERTAQIVRVAGAEGGVLDPDGATVHPGRLVRGLAAAAERRGVTVFERSRVRRIVPGRVVLDGGVVRADVIVRATEAYTAALPGLRREVAPVYHLLIATEPLPPAVWAELGWERGVTVADGRRLAVHAQRTADDRIVLGGRATPYHFGSRVRRSYDVEPAVFDQLRRALATMFPAAAAARVTHRWGGPVGVPRDRTPTVHLDRETGLAQAGGYLGAGLTASALAGRTLAELITGRSSERTGLPWVGGDRRRWEPEPLRWLGVNGSALLAATADAREDRTGRPTRIGTALTPFAGGG